MKINEYNSMMSYLTRPGKILANNINNKKIPNTDVRTPLKKGGSDTKPTPENNKMLRYIDDHNIVYGDKKATKAEGESAAKRIERRDTWKEFVASGGKELPKLSPEEIEKVRGDRRVRDYMLRDYKADKPKSNGKYTMPEINLDSFDWDIWLRENDPLYETLEEENKRAGILEFDLASEYWQQQYQNYQNTGGTLSYPQFMQQQLNNKISKNINKIAEDKKKTEGLAAILGVKV